MPARLVSLFLLACVLFGLVGGAQPVQAASHQQSPDLQLIIEKYRALIQKEMADQKIPGLTITLVDDQQVLWAEGFGYTDTNRKTPVDTSTLFSIQSMSKSFTATAVMLAVQDGLVDLDEPITTYLPDFHVNSIFEEHPERRMTLRMLLSHTAGFTHEAPIGSNYDLPTHTFEQHIASISDTWLMFPVGSRYSYSNLGIDLAGYLVQVRSGMPFTEYVKEKIYQPLGMARSTFATPEVRRETNRAIGHNSIPFNPVVPFLILPSGGVYSTAADMARYVMFHINRGTLDGKTILRTDLAETMYTRHFAPSIQAGYGLGLGVGTRHSARIISHGGGGFGFLSMMFWYPELKLGGVLLTNSATHTIQVSLLEGLLDEIIEANLGMYLSRAGSAPVTLDAPGGAQTDQLSDMGLSVLVQNYALDDPEAAARRERYAGTYMPLTWGLPYDPNSLDYKNGNLYRGFNRLNEVQPGLFFGPDGQAYDFRGKRPTYANIPLVKFDEQALLPQRILLGLGGALFLSVLLFWPVRALARRMRRRADAGLGRGLTWAAWLSALVALIGLVLVTLTLLYPPILSVPWPAPVQDFQIWVNGLLLLPYLGLLLAVGVLALVAFSWRRTQAGRGLQVYLLAAPVMTLVCQTVLIL